MPTRVKICGVTRLEDAKLALELGAAALGFNFYPLSPRYIDPVEARGIIRRLAPLVMPVGVFADESAADAVVSLARGAGVAALQLHGPRFPQLDGTLAEFPIIRAVAVDATFKAESLQTIKSAAFLLDSFDPRSIGGTGRPFDWSVVQEAKKYGTVILAGGLTPENVGRAIREVRPFAVDVASGVESALGVKDAGKLRAFFAAVAKADRDSSDDRIEGEIGVEHGR